VQRVQSKFTTRQGQYLAFICQYFKLHRQAPSEYEMAQYFKVSPPAVHLMVLTLDKKGLIARTPWQARSIRLLLQECELPLLQ